MGALAAVIDLIILMVLTKIYTDSGYKAGEASAVTFIFIHSYLYSVFNYGTVWVYTTEIFPTHLRAKGTAICTFWGQGFAILLQQIGLEVFQDIGYLFYIVFIVCTSCAGVAYYVFLPETKGATLEDISSFFGDPVVATLHESKSRIAQVLNEVNADADLEGRVGAVDTAEQDKGVVEQIEQRV
jgi:hypothetical protein